MNDFNIKVREEGDIIISDTGCGLVWTAQAFAFKKGQRFLPAFNFTPMGYALPASELPTE